MKRVLFLSLMLLFGIALNAQEKDLELKGDLIEATLYHDSGEVAQKGAYTHDGELEGKWVSYDRNGEITAIAFYDEGEKVGTWTFYQGTTMKKVTYRDSRIAKVETWENVGTRIVSNKP